MVMTIDAVFDGRSFLPIQPIKLAPNTLVQIAVRAEEHLPVSFLDVAEGLALEGPADWSLRLDEYLYGGKTLNGR